jgi:hypothetical protein
MIAASAVLAEGLLLAGATLHSMVPGEAPRVADVLVVDGRIAAIGAELERAQGVRVIELAGLHLAPGLIDAFVGFDPEHDPLYLASGVTLVRDMGNDPERIAQLREPQQRELGPGPAVLSALVQLEGKQRRASYSVPVANAADAERALGILVEQRADLISIGGDIGREAWRHLLEQGSARGLRVWGPKPSQVALGEALDAGQRGFVYLDWMLPEGVDWEIVLPSAFEASIQALGKAGAHVLPMLHATAYRLSESEDRPAVLDLLNPLYESQWLSDLAQRRELAANPDFKRIGERAVAKQAAIARRLQAAGAQLVPGSGAPHPWLVPGDGLHEELAHWQAAGLSAATVLQLATRGAAEALGQGGERGQIAVGRVADLIALAADPEQDVGALRHPAWVVLRGRALSRAQLDEALDAERAQQRALRERDQAPLELEAPELPEGALVLEGSVETRVLGLRVAAERYAVVREQDGALCYVGRRLVLQQGAVRARESHVLQRTRAGRLEEFEVKLVNGEQELSARGLLIAGRMNVERRIDGRFLSNASAKEPIAALSVDSVTTALLLGQHEQEGLTALLHFHPGLEPEVIGWRLAFHAQGWHAANTPGNGLYAFQIGNDGALVRARELDQGSEFVTVPRSSSALGGAGLPLPASKRALRDESPSSAPASGATGEAPSSAGGSAPAGGSPR